MQGHEDKLYKGMQNPERITGLLEKWQWRVWSIKKFKNSDKVKPIEQDEKYQMVQGPGKGTAL